MRCLGVELLSSKFPLLNWLIHGTNYRTAIRGHKSVSLYLSTAWCKNQSNVDMLVRQRPSMSKLQMNVPKFGVRGSKNISFRSPRPFKPSTYIFECRVYTYIEIYTEREGDIVIYCYDVLYSDYCLQHNISIYSTYRYTWMYWTFWFMVCA